MNIRLGTFLFGDDDNYVTASIEPVKPAFRESIGRVVDGGRLRVQKARHSTCCWKTPQKIAGS